MEGSFRGSFGALRTLSGEAPSSGSRGHYASQLNEAELLRRARLPRSGNSMFSLFVKIKMIDLPGGQARRSQDTVNKS